MTDSKPSRHINIVTLGCSKNLVDSEKILGQLQNGQFTVSHDSNDPADIVIINTCGFIHDAKEESIDTILRYTKAKEQGLVKEVIVTGCLSQRYKDELQASIPEADAWFGAGSPEEMFSYLSQKYSAEDQQRFLSTPPHFAYLKIAEGCDRTCSFCAIPLIRGKFISRTIDSLVEEARLLSEKGTKEILLIAQDLSYYGYDIQKKNLLSDLLRELVQINGIEWIRLHYAYPKNFPSEVIDLMATEPKICKYLDMPVQHISDEILRSMRRNITKQQTLDLLHQLRARVPGIALRTTLMVGYPGETKAHFDELLRFVEKIRFERLGVFTYSPEEGTSAYKLKDSVSAKEKSRRAEKVMELQQEISHSINQERIGKTYKVIIDREDSEFFVGRTEHDSPEVDNEVMVKKQEGISIGSFHDVLIEDAAEFELFGSIVSA